MEDQKMMTLDEAPVGPLLRLITVTGKELGDSLLRAGLSQSSTLVKVDQDESLRQSVRVKGPRGDMVFGGGMSAKIIVEKAGGKKVALTQLKPGEEGQIAALTGGPALHNLLETLGLEIGDSIKLLRTLPPMEYLVVVDRKRRIRINEGVASKIWGVMHDHALQFTSARVGEEFKVLKTLGGARVKDYLSGLGVKPDITLVLEGIKQGQRLSYGPKKHLAIDTLDGLRIFFGPGEARSIFVDIAD